MLSVLAAGRRPEATAPTIGRTVAAETGETDGDGGTFASRAADGNRATMFLDDFLD